MKWSQHDGGRAAAGFKGKTGDCVTRAIAIATGLPYKEVYDELHKRSKARAKTYRGSKKKFRSPREGVHREIYQAYLEELGWEWVPTMQVGQGCKVHLHEDELPEGRLIVAVSRHLCTVIDGTVYDAHDPRRDGKRCVYGYYQQKVDPDDACAPCAAGETKAVKVKEVCKIMNPSEALELLEAFRLTFIKGCEFRAKLEEINGNLKARDAHLIDAAHARDLKISQLGLSETDE